MLFDLSVCIGACAYDVHCDYVPPEAETGPSYASGGEPASPAELEILRIDLVMPVWQRKGRESLPPALDVTLYIDDEAAFLAACWDALEAAL